MDIIQKYYFSGIGGSGMSALAYILKVQGHWVGGSDRAYDRRQNMRLFGKLQRQGIHLFLQSRGNLPNVDSLIISSAIEQDNPEVQHARIKGIPVQHRATLLSSLFNRSFGIGIAGTSGKSTVTGMIASILDAAGKDPTVISGGIIRQYVTQNRIGNAKSGSSNLLVSEIDESDGTIVRFYPQIGVITNISKDHKELEELLCLFQTFASQTKGKLILNARCSISRNLFAHDIVRFDLNGKGDIVPEQVTCEAGGSRFVVRGTQITIKVPGKHNIENALAAIAVGMSLGIPLPVIGRGLALFKGRRRRFEVVGNRKGITVIDDFAHNPEKISASLATLRMLGNRLIVIFQPHGYGPTRFLLTELGHAFSQGMNEQDLLICLRIYDAGGSADRSITSEDLLSEINGPQLYYAQDRSRALALATQIARSGDVIAVMGARDDTLSAFARSIIRSLSQ